jgi:hypothetical protein
MAEHIDMCRSDPWRYSYRFRCSAELLQAKPTLFQASSMLSSVDHVLNMVILGLKNTPKNTT